MAYYFMNKCTIIQAQKISPVPILSQLSSTTTYSFTNITNSYMICYYCTFCLSYCMYS